MSEATVVDTAAFLATVPIFRGMSDMDLGALAGALRRVSFSRGMVLWQEGDEADGLHLIVEGRLSAFRRLPAGQEFELAVFNRGEILGEIPLVVGGNRTAGARAVEPTTALFLGRSEFAALSDRLNPMALELKRRIAALTAQRLRRRCRALALMLGVPPITTDSLSAPTAAAVTVALQPVDAPDLGYLSRIPFLREFREAELHGLLALSYFATCARGTEIVTAGHVPDACYVTVNGAVAGAIAYGGHETRVELAGPGRAFGCAHVMDHGPSPLSSTARERTVLMVVPRAAFDELIAGDTDTGRALLGTVQRNLVLALRQADAPQARLSVTG